MFAIILGHPCGAGPAIADRQVDEAIAAIERRGACPQIVYNLIE